MSREIEKLAAQLAGHNEVANSMRRFQEAMGQQLREAVAAQASLSKTLIPETSQVAARLAAANRRLQESMKSVLPQIDLFADIRRLVASSIDVSRLIDADALQSIRASLRRALPPNWPKDAEIDEMATLIEETGWPLVWLPRAEVIKGLLAAQSPRGRGMVLLNRQTQIMEDARQRLSEVHDKRLRYLAECASEAVDSLEAGHFRSSQSLLANVLTSLLQVKLGLRKFREARDAMNLKWREESIRRLRLALIAPSVAAALADYKPSQGDPIPATFNRHATVHHVSRVQMKRLNAIASVIMVTAFLREVEQLFRERRAAKAAQTRATQV